jgi:hypothetical protein
MRNGRGIAILGLVGLVATCSAVPHVDRETYRVTIIDTERIVESSGETTSSRYLVFTELSNGGTRVFENTDSVYEMKFDSSDIQGRMKGLQGQEVDIDTYGFRVPFLSMYENVLDVRPVETTYSK